MHAASRTVDVRRSNVAPRQEPASPNRRVPRELRYGGLDPGAIETDTRKPSISGWHAGRPTSPAALRRLRQCLLPAPTVLPVLRLAQGQVFEASGKARLYSYVIHHRPVRVSPRPTPSRSSTGRGPRMIIVDCRQRAANRVRVTNSSCYYLFAVPYSLLASSLPAVTQPR